MVFEGVIINNSDERNIYPIQEMTRLVNSILDLDTWNLKESYRSDMSNILIYDSE